MSLFDNIKFKDYYEDCGRACRAYICSTKCKGEASEACLEHYLKNTKHYECLLRNNRLTLNQYRQLYNPHFELNNLVYESIQKGKYFENLQSFTKIYEEDKERRIQNFIKTGKFEVDE
jgi:hypothetical protein